MEVQKLKIGSIPAILWGKDSDKIVVAVHGSHSSKIDDCTWVFAEEAAKRGWQTLSFDLPQHGERVYETGPCMVDACVEELHAVMAFARERAEMVSVFGCSMGAYFSLLAYVEEKLEKVFSFPCYGHGTGYTKHHVRLQYFRGGASGAAGCGKPD